MSIDCSTSSGEGSEPLARSMPLTAAADAAAAGSSAVLSDCTGATDHGHHVAALSMIAMQGGVFGATATSDQLLSALGSSAPLVAS